MLRLWNVPFINCNYYMLFEFFKIVNNIDFVTFLCI